MISNEVSELSDSDYLRNAKQINVLQNFLAAGNDE